MNDTEESAIEFSRTRDNLRKRFTIYCKWAGIPHRGMAVDVPAKQATTVNGVTLQWQTRRCPTLPESYTNQQTNQGYVCIAP